MTEWRARGRAGRSALFLAALAVATAMASSVPARGGAADSNARKPYFEVPLLYATSRVAQKVAGPRESYGSGRANEVSYGTAVVTIPETHMVGRLELPPTSILERRLKMPRRPRDLGKSFGVSSVTPQPDATFWSLAPKAGPTADGGVLLYLSERIFSFNDGLLRAAQVSFDLRLTQPTLLYSWPSTGGTFGYLRDRELSEFAIAGLRDVLRELGASSLRAVDVFAPGMGATIFLRALRELQGSEAPLAAKLRNVVLYAPDIDIEEFKALVPVIQRSAPKIRMTVYLDPSASDVRISSQLFPNGRVGALQTAPAGVPGVDFVYVGTADMEWEGLPLRSRVMSDLSAILTKSAPPSTRMLVRESANDGTTWRLP